MASSDPWITSGPQALPRLGSGMAVGRSILDIWLDAVALAIFSSSCPTRGDDSRVAVALRSVAMRCSSREIVAASNRPGDHDLVVAIHFDDVHGDFLVPGRRHVLADEVRADW